METFVESSQYTRMLLHKVSVVDDEGLKFLVHLRTVDLVSR
jgi:hypothetical protein